MNARSSFALLVIRAIVGLGFIFHGMMKVPHPTGWLGPHAFAPPWLQGVVTCLEVLGGAAVILGFLTQFVAILLAIDVFTAIVKVHIPMGGHFVGGPMSFEVPLVYCIVMIGLVVAGPGRFSCDALIFKRSSAGQRSIN